MSAGEPTDTELIAAINTGDARAFERLYVRHRDWVVRLARRFTGDETDALDVMQETFTYLYRKFPGFELTARMTTFLWPVVRNLSLQARRVRARAIHLDESVLDLPAPTDPARTRADEGMSPLLASLSAAHRQVVLMRFVDDLSIDQIAQLLDVPAGTVKSRLHHAIADLRAHPGVRHHFD